MADANKRSREQDLLSSLDEAATKELLTFIVANIDSIEVLEVLALLRSRENQDWSVAELDRIIRSSESSVLLRLDQLLRLGLAERSAQEPYTFRYVRPDQERRNLAERIVALYQTRRVQVTELVYTKSFKEIVSFSEAFRIRRRDNDG